MSDAVSRRFSSDYEEARRKFVAAAKAAGAELIRFRNPSTGPAGAALFADLALLGSGGARSALVLQSGTHGVEGFAGSAIQTALLHDPLLPELTRSLRLVLIHAINPWGFAHLRRVNEDNVDLNRNFIDRSRPYPNNAAYGQLADLLAPRHLAWYSRGTTVARLLAWGFVHGRAALRSAVSSGQYAYPDGLFFGGRLDVWSNRTFRDILERHVVGADRVAFIDVHTGLGRFGHGELIVDSPKGSAEYRRAASWWGDRVRTTQTDESVSVAVTGSVTDTIVDVLRSSSVTAATLELGTFPAHKVLWALIAENWAQHHLAPDDPRVRRIKDRFRQCFCVDSDDWREAVWAEAREVVSKALAELRAA